MLLLIHRTHHLTSDELLWNYYVHSNWIVRCSRKPGEKKIENKTSFSNRRENQTRIKKIKRFLIFGSFDIRMLNWLAIFVRQSTRFLCVLFFFVVVVFGFDFFVLKSVILTTSNKSTTKKIWNFHTWANIVQKRRAINWVIFNTNICIMYNSKH